MCRNQETSESTTEAITAVKKLDISNPGTNLAVNQSKATLIKKADIPNDKMEIGRAISCNIGRINVLTIPITIAATIAATYPVKTKPGTRYSTTKRAITFIPSLTINFIN